ncbi:(p)ppGpp synthetase, partial [Campylobacter coli]|nr:(p)ppGpp synthetase [Campylobacter jejuni]EAH8887968.1 (p)ppGpp synthetase [Campylobacter coli]EAI1661327.1 (p)ppGpp synthetase [Campylobacter jejuni]EAI8076529.1 (p)ppGpp synthetase [Campylobacter coli]EAI8362557.1 (p)ppGpp synthetase [Campylobacter coli]
MNISSNKLKNIGKKIKKNEELTNEEQDLFSYWLNLHFDIMKKMHRHVVDKLKKLGIKNYIIAKRTKRLESISFKLKRYPNFALDRIQDIAGMRIICDNLKDVNSIKNELKKHYQKNISVFKYSNMDDYINEPKNDGYRSYHLIFIDIKTKCKVEIQIRTKLQHSWATAVEIIDMDPYCKIKQGTGKSVYKDFFKLSSALFSRIEGTKIVEPYQNYNIEKIYYFLKILDMRSNILEKLKNSNINENITQDHKDKFYFVVYLDRNKRTNVASYSKDDLNKARKDYNNLEKNKDINVVLISLDSQKKIRKAYPNYYLDG